MIRALPGCPGYAVTDEGRVLSYWTRAGNRYVIGAEPHELADFDRKLRDGSPSGYRSVCLRRDGKRRRNYYVHELVLLAFVGARPTLDHEACHGNGKRDDNRLTNLRWGTYADNAEDRKRHARDGYVDFWRDRRAAAGVAEGSGEEEGPAEYRSVFADLLEEAAP